MHSTDYLTSNLDLCQDYPPEGTEVEDEMPRGRTGTPGEMTH